MKIRYLGHGGFHIELAGKHLVVDPFVTANELAKSIDISKIPADYVLVTHGHEDHTLDVEAVAKMQSATVISCYEIANHFKAKSLDTLPMNHGGTVHLDGLHIKMVNAIHTSGFADGSYAGNPAGFVVYTDEHCIYLSGDTALTMDMKLIPMTCPPVNVAILCIGDHFTMGYKEAAIAAKFVEAQRVIGCHYDTFGYIVIEDKEEVKNYFTQHQIELHLPAIGDTMEF